MATTVNYGWTIPTNGADAFTWGTELNATIAAIDAQMFLAAPLISPVLTTPSSTSYAISGAAATVRFLNFQTAALTRWQVNTTATAEAGSNVGSDFTIGRYNDAGTLIDTPVTLNRATGLLTLVNGLTIGGALTLNAGLTVAGAAVASGALTVGGALAVTGGLTASGAVGMAAGRVLSWNSDAGISRAGAAFLLIGNGTNGDQTGSLAAGQFTTSSNANITSPSLGVMQVGTGTTTGAGGTLNAAAFNASGGILSTGTAGVGYATGAGGTVTQATSKLTGVTLNKITGQITTSNGSLAASSTVSFLVTNSAVTLNDTVVVGVQIGGTLGAYIASVSSIGNGSFTISLRNITLGALAEAITINFAVIKGAAA